MLVLAVAACTHPYAVPTGATAYDYAPTERLTTFPDDVQTIDEPRTATGLQVQFTEGARGEFAGQVPEGWTIEAALGALDGFGTTAAVTLRFTGPIDPASLTDVQWLDLADGSAVDFDVRLTDADSTVLLDPLVPLKPATKYGVAIRNLTDAAGNPVYRAVLLDDLLRNRAADDRLIRVQGGYDVLSDVAGLDDLDAVSAAVVFTTQSIGRDEDAVKSAIAAAPPTWTPGSCADDGGLRRCEATLTALDFMGDDQVLELLPGDLPTAEREYDLPVSIWLPAGAGPFPVIVYGHGLGGDRGEGGGFAHDVADLGVAVVAIDAPAHGQHPFPGDGSILSIVAFFGVDLLNGPSFVVERLRDHWRTAAWDKLQLLAAIRAGVDADGDGTVDLDGTNIGYSGHSLGGIMGCELMALDPGVGAGELSVPGGRVSEIVQYGGTFAPLVDAMRPDSATDGDADRFFPIVQTAIERGDAANWAPMVLGGDRDVMVQMVVDDEIIPNRTTEFLARSLGVDQAPPAVFPVEGLLGLDSAPVAGNKDGRTAALFQLDWLENDDGTLYPATHTDVHDNVVGVTQFHHFWDTRLNAGLGEVIDPYSELGIER
jgi:dienelactone hydrolase